MAEVIGGNAAIRAAFTNEQLNEIANHIIDYLFTDMDSFALTLDELK